MRPGEKRQFFSSGKFNDCKYNVTHSVKREIDKKAFTAQLRYRNMGNSIHHMNMTNGHVFLHGQKFAVII
jgi:hypothetical protein